MTISSNKRPYPRAGLFRLVLLMTIVISFMPHVQVAALTAMQLDDLVSMFTQFFVANSSNIAAAVRLSFHSCVGGCNGCINPSLSANNGLAAIVQQLEALYMGGLYSAVLSRADFWILAAHVALQQALPHNSPPLPLTFQWGRVDCSTAPWTTEVGNFPAGMGNLSEVERVFVKGEFQLTLAQTVALLGAHSLGHAVPANTGFRGPWAPPQMVFSNKFFALLASKTYSHAVNIGPNPGLPAGVLPQQFSSTLGSGSRADPILMLHTDMALLRSFPVTADASGTITGVAADSCVATNNSALPGSYDSVAGCPFSPTSAQVLLYAINNTKFLNDFAEAFTLMTRHAPGNGSVFNLVNITLSRTTGSRPLTATVTFQTPSVSTSPMPHHEPSARPPHTTLQPPPQQIPRGPPRAPGGPPRAPGGPPRHRRKARPSRGG